MDSEEFLLDCDSVSNLSSLSSCTFRDARNDGLEPGIHDFLTVSSDYTSLAECDMSVEVEIVEELLVSDDKNNAFLSNISGHRTILSEDLYTYQTMITDSAGNASNVESIICDDSGVSYEVQSDASISEDECENDNHNDSQFVSLSTSFLLDKKETCPSAIGAKSRSTDSFISYGSSVSFSFSVSSVPAASSVFEKNEEKDGRLQRARQRRTEALKRYKDILTSGSTQGVAQAPVTTDKRQESLIHLVSAIEAMDGAAILASSTRTQPAKGGAAAPGTHRSIRELRSRQRESLKSLVSAFDAVRGKNSVPTNHYFKKPTSSRAERSLHLV